MTTANQASEDELKERIGNLHAYNFDGDDVTVKVMVDEDILERIAKYVKAIVRTEKLKLLAEVKERVVQSLPDTAFHGTSIRVKENIRDGGYHDGVLDSRLATEEALTKLEAEL